jgi:nuclear polyadenylated RNA-binding protein 3
VDDDLPLPKRNPRDVPDVQIIVLDTLDRDFISWVEQAFTARGVRADVLLLSPRLSEQAVVRRQIVEGVIAVVKLKRQNQDIGKISLQIFDRRNGVANVTFEEYDGLEPNIAVELVLRAKSTSSAPANQQFYGGYAGTPQQGYGNYNGAYGSSVPAYGQPQPAAAYPTYAQQPAQSVTTGVPPHLQSLVTNLDRNNLQSLLSNMNTPQSAGNSAAGAYGAHAPQQNPAYAGYLPQHQQPSASSGATGQVNMQDILAKLGGNVGGNYQR